MDLIHLLKITAGHALRPLHAGTEKLISHDPRLTARDGARLNLFSPAFETDGEVPRKHSAEGKNLSPPLRWSGVPAETKELLLCCEDPDVPKAAPFVHWIMYGLSPTLTRLAEGVPAVDVLASIPGARQGRNSAGETCYTGPMPPVGHGIHRYHFQLFALDEALRLPILVEREDLPAAMSGRVLAVGELIGTYERR